MTAMARAFALMLFAAAQSSVLVGSTGLIPATALAVAANCPRQFLFLVFNLAISAIF